MSKRLAFTQADVRRAFKGAAEAGAVVAVELRPDGTICLIPCALATPVASDFDVMGRIAAMKL